MLAKIYRKLVPLSFRMAIYHIFLGSLLQKIRLRKKRKIVLQLQEEIPAFYEKEENKGKFPQAYYNAAQWIRKNEFSLIPDDFIFEYDNKQIEVFDGKNGLKYVFHNGKQLYFPKSFTKKACQECYGALLIEQDKRSPHRYYYDCFDERKRWTIFDLGAAEGIFTLSIIDQIEKAYLFECEELWFGALQATFEPYKDKIEFVHKYVTDKNSETTVTLDTFMSGKPFDNGYIKMDIEGAELVALKGAANLIKESKISFISACTYHLDGIGQEIEDYLNGDYLHSYTSGVMAFGTKPPYFRRGVLYAKSKPVQG